MRRFQARTEQAISVTIIKQCIEQQCPA